MTAAPLPLDAQADIDFVLRLRRRWADTLYPALRAQFEASNGRGGPEDAQAARKAATPAIQGQPLYPWFAWTERGSQKQLWRAVSAAVADAGPIELPADPKGSLELDPDLALPDWYTDWDIHIQPGGVWRADASARVYELGAKLVMMGDNDDYAFHQVFADTCLTPLKDLTPSRLVDLGCGFGKSTWVLKQAFPQAEVIGVDLAAPCLKLAHAKCEAMGLPIRFIQADAADTGLEAASADLVTATMVIHELPQPALKAFFAEAARLLKPGGILRVLDFQLTGDAFRDLAVMEHGARNNEPFMPGMMAADTVAMAQQAGLGKGQWVAFDERGAGRRADLTWPDRPEWHFPWAVLEAEKPA
jgi:ubiquinone/menaquinone biosynthesis C-methylase UbiE